MIVKGVTSLEDRDIDYQELKKHFGKQLRNERNKKNLTHGEVAKDTYIDEKILSKIENGKRGPALVTLFKLRKRTNISVDKIIDNIDEDQVLIDPDG